jgi:hypothetical protein
MPFGLPMNMGMGAMGGVGPMGFNHPLALQAMQAAAMQAMYVPAVRRGGVYKAHSAHPATLLCLHG